VTIPARLLIAAAVPIAWMIFANLGRAESPARRMPARVPVPDVRPVPPDLTRPVVEPLSIVRNPFTYAPRDVPPMSPPPAPISVAPPPEAPLALIGVATATLEDGHVVRTAIITGARVLYLVRDGDVVATRYRVEAVLPESVRLVDDAAGASLSLVLR
jgi:hypothetical protein